MKISILSRALLVLSLAVVLVPARPAASQAAPVPIDRNAPFVPGEVVVSFPDGLSLKEYQNRASALAGQMRAQVVSQIGNIAVLSADPNADVPAMVQSLSKLSVGVQAQPNYVYWFPENGTEAKRTVPASSPYTFKDQKGRTRSFTAEELRGMRSRVRRSGRTLSIPAFPVEYTSDQFKTWGWGQVSADIVWRNATASPAVCVIDSGVDASHPDLSGRVIQGPDFVNNDAIPNDDNGHGTHVTGIITALSNNSAGSAIGVSNGKVVAVKAMNAQGFGTTATVSAALRYCAGQASVKVINMSLGSDSKDPIEYANLQYAIVTKGKLVVAAAGNSGSTAPSYPAAYANLSATAPGGGQNVILPGIVSVTAGSSNPASIRIWVDLNNDNVRQESEFFDGQDCATEFSNFGPGVDLVAPGDMIYSTQPVKYTFFNKYYYGYQSKYDYYSGTSMAAPYVSAAAVRMLSVFPNLPAYSDQANVVTMKKRLVSTGRPLTYAFVPKGGAAFNANVPFDWSQNPGYRFGEVIYPEPDSRLMPVLRMPFCWPKASGDASNPYGAAQDMSRARYLDVSAAMGRVAFYAEATDATTGIALSGASILMSRQNGTAVDTGIVGSTSPGVFLLNVPVPTTGSVQYYLWVNKSGYTSGYQFFESPKLQSREDNPNAPIGGLLITPYSTLAVPPNKDITVVLDWDRLSSANLDMYLWLPENATSANGSIHGVVNPGPLLDYLPGYPPNLDLGLGSLLDASQYNPGSVSPYAQVMHDGGDPFQAQDGQQFDTIKIRRKPGVSQVLPYYTGVDTQPYDIFVTDYTIQYGASTYHQSNHYLSLANDPNFAYPIVRVWIGGKLVDWSALALETSNANPPVLLNPSCDNTTYDWWFALRLQGSAITRVNQCGTAGAGTAASHGILPYPQAP